MNEILAFMPGPCEWIVIIGMLFIVFVVPAAIAIIFLIVYFVRNNREKQELRTKIKELTEEINRLKDKIQR
jgi:cell division protein FtsL